TTQANMNTAIKYSNAMHGMNTATTAVEYPTMSLVGNAAVLVAGQMVSKVFTFSLNQLLLSYTSPSALGIAQLVEFVLDYTLFLSREAIRLTIAKLPKSLESTRSQW
ncbi:hypothetical protein B9K06_26125, partial [Bacillus sp. OG2]